MVLASLKHAMTGTLSSSVSTIEDHLKTRYQKFGIATTSQSTESHAPESSNSSNEINSIAEQSKKIMRENAMRYQNERLASLKKQNRKTTEPGTLQSVFTESVSKPERSATAPVSSANSESYQSITELPSSELSVTSEDSNISNAGQNILDELSYSLAR